MDPIRIQIFRNCGFALTVPTLDVNSFPVDLTGYNFMMSIAATPTPPSDAFGALALMTYFPASGSGSGSVTYVFSAEETAELDIATAYQYSAVAQAPGADPGVLQYGTIQLIDTPAMPVAAPF